MISAVRSTARCLAARRERRRRPLAAFKSHKNAPLGHFCAKFRSLIVRRKNHQGKRGKGKQSFPTGKFNFPVGKRRFPTGKFFKEQSQKNQDVMPFPFLSLILILINIYTQSSNPSKPSNLPWNLFVIFISLSFFRIFLVLMLGSDFNVFAKTLAPISVMFSNSSLLS